MSDSQEKWNTENHISWLFHVVGSSLLPNETSKQPPKMSPRLMTSYPFPLINPTLGQLIRINIINKCDIQVSV